jgi:NAD(P)-dependent dehydrogenase (short-subunit alcohol dehydrogenase family)
MQTSVPPGASADAVLGTKAHPDDYPRAALVTGAALRLGRAIALDLAEAGWSVAIHHRNSAAAAHALETEIRERGGNAIVLNADLTREDQAGELVARAVEALGPLGLLVNNAAVFEPDQASDATRESWDLHMETNLRAPFVLTQAFAAALPTGMGGVVANLLDERVLALPGDYITYSLSKAGLWSLTRSLAIALAPRVRVVGIGPGHSLPARGDTEASFRAAVERLPLARSAPPEDICLALRFFIACKSVTGQMIALDSGHHLVGRPYERAAS